MSATDVRELAAVRALCRAGLPAERLAGDAGARLARHLGAAAFCFLVLEPRTGLPVHVVGNGHPPEVGEVLASRLMLRSPFADWGARALEPRRAYRLEDLVPEPGRDAYVRHVVRGFGFEHEVQLSLAHDGLGWGHVCLSRRAGDPPFTPGHVRFLEAAAPHLTSALRGAASRAAIAAGGGGAVGVLLLDERGRVEAVNPLAGELLEARVEGGRLSLPLAVTVIAGLLSRSLSGESAAPVPAITWRHPRRGGRLRLSGEILTDAAGRRRGAVLVSGARPLEDDAVALQLGLTGREAEVAAATVRGLTTAQIGTALGVSPHTVDAHLRKVFSKLQVGSRAELAGVLLGR